MHTPRADQIGLPKRKGGDSAGLLALIARLRARLERARPPGRAVVSCSEAG